jgi:hypothetical protein
MNVRGAVWEILGAIFILAVVSLLVRPKSLGPAIVADVGQAFANVITFAVSS